MVSARAVLITVVLYAVLAITLGHAAAQPLPHRLSPMGPITVADQQTPPNSACNIKGNISFRTGERIYHVPGDKYYRATKINPAKGERWFCSEAEARRAGWRRSKV